MNWKKMSSCAPVLSAAFLTACVGISLQGYTQPIYEVSAVELTEEDIKNIKDDSKKGSVEEKEEAAEVLVRTAAGSFDVADGTYEGSGTGFKGKITVSVQVKDKKIISIDIVSVEADDAAFFNQAKAVVDRIIAAQSLDVDVVSGATYSSNGIIAAVKNALTGTEDTAAPAALADGTSIAGGSATVSQVSDTSAYQDGTYYGTGTGFAGPITVEVVISGGKISSIQVTQSSDGSSYLQSASSLLSNIITLQSTNVDAVSGATYSSVGLIEAVRNALSQAAIREGTQTPSIETNDTTQDLVSGTIPYEDGIYYGTAEGYLGDITVAVVIQDKTIKAVLITKQQDDEVFFNKAKVVVTDVVAKQSTQVDTISGATYSSKGILNAIDSALKEAEKVTNKEEDAIPEEPENPETPENPENPIIEEGILYKNGEYDTTIWCNPDEEQDFESYILSMKVTIQTDKIVGITEIKGDGDTGNDSYINRAAMGTSSLIGVVPQILEKQELDQIDTVSRATCTSQAIIEGCRQVLEFARNTTESGESEDEFVSN